MNSATAHYRYAVRWIAHNDEESDLSVASVAQYLTTSLIADTFNKTPEQVAKAIVRIRKEREA